MILLNEVNAILSNAVLKEERGVAAHKYRDVVREIVEYCQDNIGPGSAIGSFHTLSGDNGPDFYIIKIPEEITSKIDIIANLEIIVSFSEMGSSVVTNSGGGRITYKKINGQNFTSDGRIASATINLEAFHHEGKVLERTLTNSLYHELNHAYDVWSRRKSFSVAGYNDNVTRGYDVRNKIDFSQNRDVNFFFKELFYRLFIPTEFNALVSGVYGDLSGMNSERINFSEDIHKTQAAWILDNFTKDFDDCLKLASVDSLMEACKYMGIDGVSRQDARTFLITFKQEFERKIREIWKRIGRVASMWYDNKEEADLNKNGFTTE